MPLPPAEDHKALIPKHLILLTAVLIAEKVILMEDIWPHLGLITPEIETQGCIDEVELLLNKQIKLV